MNERYRKEPRKIGNIIQEVSRVGTTSPILRPREGILELREHFLNGVPDSSPRRSRSLCKWLPRSSLASSLRRFGLSMPPRAAWEDVGGDS